MVNFFKEKLVLHWGPLKLITMFSVVKRNQIDPTFSPNDAVKVISVPK